MRLMSGKVHHDEPFSTRRVAVMERLGSLHSVQGKTTRQVDDAHAGDIIAASN